MRPDFGLRLMKDGFPKGALQYFYDFRLYSLSVLRPGQYSTMVDMSYAGEVYALSLDFNHKQLEQILAKGPPSLAGFLRAEISQDPSTPRTIDFDGEISFGVAARLGELQHTGRETFVPLIAVEIL